MGPEADLKCRLSCFCKLATLTCSLIMRAPRSPRSRSRIRTASCNRLFWSMGLTSFPINCTGRSSSSRQGMTTISRASRPWPVNLKPAMGHASLLHLACESIPGKFRIQRTASGAMHQRCSNTAATAGHCPQRSRGQGNPLQDLQVMRSQIPYPQEVSRAASRKPVLSEFQETARTTGSTHTSCRRASASRDLQYPSTAMLQNRRIEAGSSHRSRIGNRCGLSYSQPIAESSHSTSSSISHAKDGLPGTVRPDSGVTDEPLQRRISLLRTGFDQQSCLFS